MSEGRYKLGPAPPGEMNICIVELFPISEQYVRQDRGHTCRVRCRYAPGRPGLATPRTTQRTAAVTRHSQAAHI